MGEKMRNAPVFFTVAQIRFNPILDMHVHIEALQAGFRRLGFSGFSVDNVASVQVDISKVPPRVIPSNQQRWRFTNSRRTAEIVLFSNSIAYQTTSYETSEEFRARLLGAAQILHDDVHLDYVEQIGFRTLDAVVPTEDHPLEVLLKPELLGFYLDSDGELKQSILEGTSVVAPKGFLVRRVVIIRGPLGLPLDLMPLPLQIDSRFTSVNNWHAVLDMDYAEQQQFDFNIDAIGARLATVKAGASKAFYGVVTDKALEMWR